MWNFLKQTFSKTTTALGQGLGNLFKKNDLPQAELLNELENFLISADFGTGLAQRLTQNLKKQNSVSLLEVQNTLSSILQELFFPYTQLLRPSDQKPWVVLFLGVNGSGKTTAIGKLAHLFHQEYSVRLIAADTFRAAAGQQLEAWAEHSKVKFWGPSGRTDPASVVYSGLEQALVEKDDIVFIDTAGRLPNRKDLIDELSKIHRIIQKFCPDPATQQCRNVLVLDATSGQHVLVQAETFSKALPLSGLIMNKLDTCAKGGLLAALTEKYHLPIYGLGTGEKPQDFQPFDPTSFIQQLWEKTP
ncbi:MAG: hypothetical protein BGO07_04400 [Alphaproteobacteria bacterium 40-19]|nr:MAG: hypothetical protein BGO07_04400 [Alphaproteobacteria bacterium 40-19]